MMRSRTFTTVFAGALAMWGCGAADGSTDSTDTTTHTASDEISTDTDGGADGATETTTDDGGKTGKGDMDGGCEGDKKPGE